MFFSVGKNTKDEQRKFYVDKGIWISLWRLQAEGLFLKTFSNFIFMLCPGA